MEQSSLIVSLPVGARVVSETQDIEKAHRVSPLQGNTDSWGILLREGILSKLAGLSSEQVASCGQIVNHWRANPSPRCRRASLLVWFLQSRSFS